MSQPPTDQAGDRVAAVEQFHSSLLGDDPTGPGYYVSGWGTAESQAARFAAMTRAVGYAGGSVVDYGCGTGDLYGYLRALGHPLSYLGLDMNPELLDRAQQTHAADFRLIPPDDTDFPSADYVFASGIFQFRDALEPDYYVRLLARLFERCQVGLAVTFLSAARADADTSPDELYLTPGAVAELGAALSRRWVVDHSYHRAGADMTLAIMRPR